MDMTTDMRKRLTVIAAILLRAGVIGMLMMSVAACAFWLAGDLIYGIHHDLMGVSIAQLKVIHYAGLMLCKMAIFVFFLIPYLAIRWVLRVPPLRRHA